MAKLLDLFRALLLVAWAAVCLSACRQAGVAVTVVLWRRR